MTLKSFVWSFLIIIGIVVALIILSGCGNSYEKPLTDADWAAISKTVGETVKE